MSWKISDFERQFGWIQPVRSVDAAHDYRNLDEDVMLMRFFRWC